MPGCGPLPVVVPPLQAERASRAKINRIGANREIGVPGIILQPAAGGRLSRKSNNADKAVARSRVRRRPIFQGAVGLGRVRREREEAVVETVTVAVAAEPFRAAGLGETAQVEFAGAPVQVKVTGWSKPPSGARVSI